MSPEDDPDAEPMPLSACPRCGATQPDPDGFGVQGCHACGYCRHPCQTLIKTRWVCDLCGREEST